MNWPPWKKKKPVEHRFIIGKKELTCLIRGGQLTFATKDVMVHLILQDIGFRTIENIIADCDVHEVQDWVKESLVVEE